MHLERTLAALCLGLLASSASLAESLPQRWISAGGATTEWIVELGGQPRLVGVDTTSQHPQSVTSLPSVGYQRQLSAEGVLTLAPDLLLGTEEMGPPPVLAQLERRWGPVAMVGYVFIRTAKAHAESSPERRRLKGVDTLFVGGDTRYGLGRLRRVAFDVVKQGGLFGAEVNLDAEVPEVTHSTVWAHAHSEEPLSGALELLGGWDHRSILNIHQSSPLWQPGSRSKRPIQWTIGASGLWIQYGAIQIEDYARGY